MLNKLHLLAFIGLAVCSLVGCGDDRPSRVLISGQVLIDGKPVPKGYVRFIPANGRPSTGKLDAEGRFTLGCFEPGDGAIVGSHRVEVNGKEFIDDTHVRWHAPKKYAQADTSGLTQEVSAPNDSLIINVSWDGKPGPFVEVLEDS